jgi:hypothetical protein
LLALFAAAAAAVADIYVLLPSRKRLFNCVLFSLAATGKKEGEEKTFFPQPARTLNQHGQMFEKFPCMTLDFHSTPTHQHISLDQ